MNNGIAKLAIFVGGALIGSAVTWCVLKKKYDKLANEEIEAAKEYGQEEPKSKTTEYSEMLKEEMSEMLDELNYNSTNKNEEEGEPEAMEDKPYVISPDEFGEDYQTESLTYYADKVVTNDLGDVLDDEDIDALIGRDSLRHFGEYEDDSVFVRNDKLRIDYEILLDPKNYRDIGCE